MKNYCYIDGQNLHLGTASATPSWSVDLYRFRVYLREKYHVEKAFYYLGYIQEGLKIEQLYENIQNAGFILVFRQHNSAMVGSKKGNVDSDIIFSVMKRLQKDPGFDKIVLVSGDGDYKMLVDYLIEESKLEKILFPNKKFRSSLYKEIGAPYFAYLDDRDVKKKVAHAKHKK
ncbi:MAG TPA: NYN domain-containing protein [Candidatus Saccharimonadales bacterium]|nr:NYN domain-containing protein [Candidatus Saccharimonadales bacterium]